MLQPAAKKATAPIELDLPANCLSEFKMDFHTFVLEGCEVYVEGRKVEDQSKGEASQNAMEQTKQTLKKRMNVSVGTRTHQLLQGKEGAGQRKLVRRS